ncbi:gamma-glutamylcyclotransferase [Photobacterium jeanii]|nr:gamma-glutamylcyclotransferase [Photobacterium jeanii]
MESTNMELVFVYGTLRRGESNHALLQHAKCLGEAVVSSGYVLHDLGPYPGVIVDKHSQAPLHGEVYQVDSETFAALDRLEEYPTGYDRELVVTPYGAAWLYVYLHSVTHAPVISNGDWCRR